MKLDTHLLPLPIYLVSIAERQPRFTRISRWAQETGYSEDLAKYFNHNEKSQRILKATQANSEQENLISEKAWLLFPLRSNVWIAWNRQEYLEQPTCKWLWRWKAVLSAKRYYQPKLHSIYIHPVTQITQLIMAKYTSSPLSLGTTQTS